MIKPVKTKESLRKEIRTTRKALSVEEKRTKDIAIKTHLESLPIFQAAKTILFYISNQEEVDTHSLIKKWLGQKNIVIPVTHPQERTMKLCHLEDWEDLKPGKFGILEIPIEKHIPANHYHIDLIIVPGIAFDSSGHRIGYGKGYYDTLLNNLSAPTIGLAYDCQMIETIPHEKHDIPIQTILTETQIHTP
ncbi:MAG: 5-formyltetrahydrofolate cyclo-ligase [Candidatus Peregrinibacteria bacterium]|nr:5-formyltetrahydrofolate cyclo-ligase [Candidatus Peregrinibacteria bacterium]